MFANIKSEINMELESKICKYRNCEIDISKMRKDAIFCCRKHKTYENIYKKREKNKKGIQIYNI